MEERIQIQLAEIEKRHQVKILYACETGSRAWGFPSPDSDFDVRMIYKHDQDWYLTLSQKRDTIEFMSDDRELDITGWEIGKCLKLMWKSNGALSERLQSPIVYRNENNIANRLRVLSDRCFNPVAALHHYLGMAKKSFAELKDKDVVKLKKLFYALRATLACKWIVEKNSAAPIVFAEMVNGLDFDQTVKNKIASLIDLKSGKEESYMHPAEKDLELFIFDELAKAEFEVVNLPGRKEEVVDLDEIFREIIKSN